ncbi:hypothetical protein DFQ26_007536 [Actinomortierella ambigua]|nr:hypothetical protein DFQ26_007536 [Actinomortierella ambigua]
MRGQTTYHNTTTTKATTDRQQQHKRGKADENALRAGGVRLRAIRSARSVREVIDGSILQPSVGGSNSGDNSPTVALVEVFGVWRFKVRDPTAQEYEQIMQDHPSNLGPTSSKPAAAASVVGVARPTLTPACSPPPLSASLSPLSTHLDCVHYEMGQSLDLHEESATGFLRLIGIPFQRSPQVLPDPQEDNFDHEPMLSFQAVGHDGHDDQMLLAAAPAPPPPPPPRRSDKNHLATTYTLLVVQIRRALLAEIRIAMRGAS